MLAAITSEFDALASVGRLGIEPRTYGLKEQGDHEHIHAFNPNLILPGSFVARRVLELASNRNTQVLDMARVLAAIVLAGDEVRLAHKVAEGGPSAIVHTVELAERMLSGALDNADSTSRRLRR